MRFGGNLKVFFAPGSTDLRKAINGLSLLVEEEMEQSSLSGNLFVFCNKDKNLLKILYWERNGFCLWTKRLERGQFAWPMSNRVPLVLSEQELSWLLDGLSIEQPKAHRPLNYSTVS